MWLSLLLLLLIQFPRYFTPLQFLKFSSATPSLYIASSSLFNHHYFGLLSANFFFSMYSSNILTIDFISSFVLANSQLCRPKSLFSFFRNILDPLIVHNLVILLLFTFIAQSVSLLPLTTVLAPFYLNSFISSLFGRLMPSSLRTMRFSFFFHYLSLHDIIQNIHIVHATSSSSKARLYIRNHFLPLHFVF